MYILNEQTDPTFYLFKHKSLKKASFMEEKIIQEEPIKVCSAMKAHIPYNIQTYKKFQTSIMYLKKVYLVRAGPDDDPWQQRPLQET